LVYSRPAAAAHHAFLEMRHEAATAARVQLAILLCIVPGSYAGLEGGPEGRGWGGATAATDCPLGITAEHPNPKGFRVTVRTWKRHAVVAWSFDERVEVQSYWGPVKMLPRSAEGNAPVRFRIKGTRAGKPEHAAVHRTDQWGFILSAPYAGGWRVSCHLPAAPPPPPSGPRLPAVNSTGSTTATGVQPKSSPGGLESVASLAQSALAFLSHVLHPRQSTTIAAASPSPPSTQADEDIAMRRRGGRGRRGKRKGRRWHGVRT
jgi:hypothetical protein